MTNCVEDLKTKFAEQKLKPTALQQDNSEQDSSPGWSLDYATYRRDTIGCSTLPERGAVTSVCFVPPANQNIL